MSELTPALWQELEIELKTHGGTGSELQVLVGDKGVALRRMVAQKLIEGVTLQSQRYPLSVRYASLEDAIQAGEYTYINELIAAFEIRGEIIIDTELALYRPYYDIKSDDVVREIDRMDMRPATLQEICGFGEKYPLILSIWSVVALGSVTMAGSKKQWVPLAGPFVHGRMLGMEDWNREWPSHYCFLAAPKPAEQAGK